MIIEINANLQRFHQKNPVQGYWEPISTVMLSTNSTKIGVFYDSYKTACAPNPVLDLNYQYNYRYFEDFLLRIVSASSILYVFNIIITRSHDYYDLVG